MIRDPAAIIRSSQSRAANLPVADPYDERRGSYVNNLLQTMGFANNINKFGSGIGSILAPAAAGAVGASAPMALSGSLLPSGAIATGMEGAAATAAGSGIGSSIVGTLGAIAPWVGLGLGAMALPSLISGGKGGSGPPTRTDSGTAPPARGIRTVSIDPTANALGPELQQVYWDNDDDDDYRSLGATVKRTPHVWEAHSGGMVPSFNNFPQDTPAQVPQPAPNYGMANPPEQAPAYGFRGTRPETPNYGQAAPPEQAPAYGLRGTTPDTGNLNNPVSDAPRASTGMSTPSLPAVAGTGLGNMLMKSKGINSDQFMNRFNDMRNQISSNMTGYNHFAEDANRFSFADGGPVMGPQQYGSPTAAMGAQDKMGTTEAAIMALTGQLQGDSAQQAIQAFIMQNGIAEFQQLALRVRRSMDVPPSMQQYIPRPGTETEVNPASVAPGGTLGGLFKDQQNALNQFRNDAPGMADGGEVNSRTDVSYFIPNGQGGTDSVPAVVTPGQPARLDAGEFVVSKKDVYRNGGVAGLKKRLNID